MNYFWMNSVYFISQVLYIDGVCVVSYPAAICWSFFFASIHSTKLKFMHKIVLLMMLFFLYRFSRIADPFVSYIQSLTGM